MGGRRMLVRLRAVLVGRRGMDLGVVVVALGVLVGRLQVVVCGGGVVCGRLVVMVGGGMLGGCHDSRSSLSSLRVVYSAVVRIYPQKCQLNGAEC